MTKLVRLPVAEAFFDELKRFGYPGKISIDGASEERLEALVRLYTVSFFFYEFTNKTHEFIEDKKTWEEVRDKLGEISCQVCNVVERGK